MKKILIDLSFVRETIFMGISKYAYRILDYIISINEQESFILLLNPRSSTEIIRMYPEFKYKIIEHKYIGKLPIIGPIYYAFLFKKIINNSDDIGLVFCPWGNIISSLKLDVPKISVIHDLQFRKDTKGVQLLLRKIVDDLVVKNSDDIVTISEFSKNEILKFYPSIENKVISLGNVVTYSQEYDLRYVEKNYILYVGRICEMKNIITLVKAFILISHKIPHKLVIVGQKNKYWEQKVYPLIINAGIENRVQLLCGISEKELNGLYKNSSLFVFPSLREGFGFPPIEAAYMEIPVLTTKCDSLPEVTMGLLNYYENPTDESELAQSILNILKEKKDAIELKKIASIYKRTYDVNVVSERIYAFIKNKFIKK